MIYYKVQIYFENHEQTISKLDDIFSHILHMSS
jgi:hypothetical protein